MNELYTHAHNQTIHFLLHVLFLLGLFDVWIKWKQQKIDLNFVYDTGKIFMNLIVTALQTFYLW